MDAAIPMISRVIFPQFSSLFIPILSLVILVSLSGLGLLEFTGNHLQYSKFLNVKVKSTFTKTKKITLSSRIGMLLIYTPAFLSGFASFLIFPNDDLRFVFLKSAVTIHFFKRILEVLIVHKYSGGMALDSFVVISIGYFSAASAITYAQHLTQGLPEPPVDLKYIGVVVFLLGISGNFYHHHILASLRKEGDEGYKIPKGGLFGLVICPHYLFEILGFVGISLISQTLCGLCAAVGVAIYLMGRSYVTRKWYLSKFEDFPKNVKALIPFVF